MRKALRRRFFERPQKPNTIKFIKRLTSLTYKIETVDYDFTEAYDELQQYAEKLLIENERISDLADRAGRNRRQQYYGKHRCAAGAGSR